MSINNIKTKLLLIEGEEKIRKIVRIYLKNDNFDIIEAENGEIGMRMLLSLNPEIAIIDLILPDANGKDLIKNIREFSKVPIIACLADGCDGEIISALNDGADDYIAKPFNPEIMLAKINCGLRRSILSNNETIHECLVNGPININLLKHEIIVKDKKVFFSPKQYNLLKYLMMNKGKVLTHKEILKEIWGKAYVNENQYLRVQIGNIREKIRSQLTNDIIYTEPGVGYRMKILD